MVSHPSYLLVKEEHVDTKNMSRRTSAVNWVQLSNWREEEQMNLPLMDLMLEREKSLDFVSVGMFILSNNTLISEASVTLEDAMVDLIRESGMSDL